MDTTLEFEMVTEALAVHEANGTSDSMLAQRLREAQSRYARTARGGAGVSAVVRESGAEHETKTFTGRSSAASKHGGASDKARDYATSLWNQRQSEGLAVSHPILHKAGSRMVSGGQIDWRTCSDLIDVLKRTPWRQADPAPTAERTNARVEQVLTEGAPAPLEAGYYRLDGDFYRVKISRSSGRPYAERWGGGEAGLDNQWSYELGKSVARRLTADNKLTAEDAKEFGDEYHSCIFCRQELTDGRSVSAGYGPICGPKNGLPWG